jgi:microcompartment protein CcmL/EutN
MTEQSMTVSMEDMSQEAVDLLTASTTAEHVLLTGLVGLIAGQSTRPDDVTIVIAGDFVASVQRRLGDDAAEYGTARLGGFAAAKTIPSPDGHIDVVVPAELIFFSEEETDEERKGRVETLLHVAQHEAQHVGMRQRDEATHDVRTRLSATGVRADFIAAAGVMLEEYRAERVAARPPFAGEDRFSDSLPDTLEALATELSTAVILISPDEPIDRTLGQAMTAVHNFWLVLAYLAAHQHQLGTSVPPLLLGHSRWARHVADHWDELDELLARVPAGDVPTDRRVIDGLVVELADQFPAWLNTIGFDYRDVENGAYFDVLRYDF